MTSTSLLVKGLGRQFGAVLALDDFSIEVPKGELISLLGPSGCGKTRYW
jgi:ABC-type Fe3+/spermidine/putrescine transport system ATPase subunit